jgi:hypothetical protein
VIIVRHARGFLSFQFSWKIGMKWKTTNVRDAFQHHKPKKILRKSVKFLNMRKVFAKMVP